MKAEDIIKNTKENNSKKKSANKRRNYFNSTSCNYSNSSNISRSKYKSSIR